MRIKLDTPLSFSEIAHCIACRPPRENRIAEYISTDTRELSFGDVFISLRGKNYDGESFLEEAKKKGAFTVSTVKELADFHVSDTEDSLLKLSKHYKETALPNLKLTVAITGSVGKTTTKEIVCALLKEKYMVQLQLL